MKIKPVNKKLCRYLKAKSPYGPLEGGDHPWFLLDEANTICWCIKSAGAAGPDSGLVSPANCQKGRSCYTPMDESDLL